MGGQQSKEELLYQQVSYGNIDGIRMLRAQGAGLEWMDKEGKTPLILACLRHDLLPVASTLIEMGANVNAYRPGCHAGTPLHHAAKKGFEQTVHLLLSNGANPFVLNDDCHTALDLAREKGHLNVVRAIESRISLFSGWLREAYGPGFLEAFAPLLLMRKIWAVVLPCDTRNPTRPQKFELAIYSDLQTAKPRIVIPLWKAQVEGPKFNQVDPAVIIVDKATRGRYKLLSAREGDKQQLQWFFNACQGISQVANLHPAIPTGPAMLNLPHTIPNTSTQAAATAMPNQEDIDIAMAINASLQTVLAEGVPHVQPDSETSNTNGWGSSSHNTTFNGWGLQNVDTQKMNNQVPVAEPSNTNGWAVPEVQSNASASQADVQNPVTPVIELAAPPPAQVAPSAPPIAEDTFLDGPINYPSIDSSPIDMIMPMEIAPGTAEVKDGATSSFSKLESGKNNAGSSASGCCVICLDAPVEGACIPCGHMAGCMSCLKEIDAKKWGCPVCRAKIDQVIKLYAV
ncbi:putative E3 ubiquitin-protein ligase XBOS34 [Canna indica]|uniref:E3 ubiquitin-protein ligase XBOS34 n=1 Tax=Canna indica TaxID=4628 RepID=A0AAQ3K8S9_9LILI|nr:putative E3 ubiquitin-protein ligase XBOS34 [Canna indica]